ncbi:MAG TPA: hypothetical protein VL017_09560, partial [Devosia sp.]|nr:hypothetical protein [Devosia sp.]
MADYKELLRRAITALPENNGAARRAVYEKARSALVGQLRAITPPLPARDITQHRLQLEDCIRQVEQEASEAVITLGRESVVPPRAPAPVAEPVPPPPAVSTPPVAVEAPKPTAVEAPKLAAPVAAEASKPAGIAPKPPAPTSIEDIISQASAVADEAPADRKPATAPEPDAKPDLRVMPAIVSRVQANRTGPTSPVPQSSNIRPLEAPLRGPSFEPHRDAIPLAANSAAEATRVTARIEPSMGNQAVARQQVVAPMIEPVPVEAALSSVREVDVEPDATEAQGVIERAIEVLDREARGEQVASLPDTATASFARPPAAEESDDAGFADAPAQRSGAGLTIFLVVFAILLAGVGGAGFWAWREGYVDLDQMFGQAQATVTDTADTTDTTPTLDPVQPAETADDPVVGPGNTAPVTPATDGNAELSGLEIEDRLEPTPEAVQPTGNETVLPDVNSGEVK